MSENVLRMQKTALWEQAKGTLRAVSMTEGHRRIVTDGRVDDDRWAELDQRIESFIKGVETDGLQE